MRIELRHLSGARIGAAELFEQSVITVGRHPLCDLRFDAKVDLDVSVRHAEIRTLKGRVSVRDHKSTNGTWVNDIVVTGERALRTGDVIAFGKAGPRVEVILERIAIASPPGGTTATEASLPTNAPSSRGSPHADRTSVPLQSPPRTAPRYADPSPPASGKRRGLVITAVVLIALALVALVALVAL